MSVATLFMNIQKNLAVVLLNQWLSMKWCGKFTFEEKACFKKAAPILYDQLFQKVSAGLTILNNSSTIL